MTPPSVPPSGAAWSCADVRALAPDAAAEPDTAEARRSLAEHLAACEPCRAARAREAALVARLRRVDPAREPAPPALRRGLLALAIWTRRRRR